MVDLDISTGNILENILQIGQKNTYYLLSICENSEITALLRHCSVGKFILKNIFGFRVICPQGKKWAASDKQVTLL